MELLEVIDKFNIYIYMISMFSKIQSFELRVLLKTYRPFRVEIRMVKSAQVHAYLVICKKVLGT